MYLRVLVFPTETNDMSIQSKGKPLGTFSQAASLPCITWFVAGPVIQANMFSLHPDGFMISVLLTCTYTVCFPLPPVICTF